MTALRNQVNLIGNLGKKPEVKTFDSGKQIVTFSLATSDHYVDNKGEKKQETQWHNIVAFGKTAKICETYLDKGAEIALNGKIVYRQYEDKDGNKKIITEIIANEILMLGKKSQN
ncbi:MAG: single-stranded DNA-binding protein [Sphingobacteriales bacterium]|jgi:single-strand DNA-binding protein|nr:MAG: single-stranded DNA-binding protein [Sphingobacteriales bacterium]